MGGKMNFPVKFNRPLNITKLASQFILLFTGHVLNPLTPTSDQNGISPYNHINKISRRKVMIDDK